jgi:hypothetical protein
MEWVDIRRHMSTGAGRIEEDGARTDPVSSDLHMRSYFEAWRRHMTAGATATGKLT